MEDKILKAIEEMNSNIGANFNAIETRLNTIEIRQTDSLAMLIVLDHLAKISKAEYVSIQLDIAEIKEEIKGIRRDLTAVEAITSKNWNVLANMKTER